MSTELSTFSDLRNLFGLLLNTQFDSSFTDSFDRKIPLALRELYNIKKQYDNVVSDNELFEKQDHLVSANQLKETYGRMEFLKENQGNWTCEVNVNTENPKVYKNLIELSYVSLQDFLFTYALQELTFVLKNISSNDFSLREIDNLLSSCTPVWTNKNYILDEATHSFYLYDNNCLLMNAYGTFYFSSNDAEKLASAIKKFHSNN